MLAPHHFDDRTLLSGTPVRALPEYEQPDDVTLHWQLEAGTPETPAVLTLLAKSLDDTDSYKHSFYFAYPHMAVHAACNPTFTKCAIWSLIERAPSDQKELVDILVEQAPELTGQIANTKDDIDLTMSQLTVLTCASFHAHLSEPACLRDFVVSLARECDLMWEQNQQVDWYGAEKLIRHLRCLHSDTLKQYPELAEILKYAEAEDDWDSGYVANWPTTIMDVLGTEETA